MHEVIKTAYRALPLKRELFTAIRAFGVPASYRRMYFDGPFRLRVDADRAFWMIQHNRYGIETELFWNGLDEGWETASLAAWMKLCTRAEVIMDIGAAEGLYALSAKCIQPQAHVFAFEPFEQPLQELKRNIAHNDYDITVCETALANFTGSADFFATLESSNEGSLVPPDASAADLRRYAVPVTTLADVVREHGLRRLDLMKIDVEGAEPEVLEGLGPLLASFRPSILIEILNDEVASRVQQRVEGLGYLYFDINDDARKGPKTMRRVATMSKSICLNYLLVQPDTAEWLGLT